jgi:uncharacterized protein (TIGR03435 family)
MISGFISADFLLNHLWQSTLFAAAAALLTLAFRKNHAQVRYSLWLAASIKFLIPLTLFIAMGNSINLIRPRDAAATPPAFSFVQDISQPFDSAVGADALPAAAKTNRSRLFRNLGQATWFCGFIAVLIIYGVRLRRARLEFRKGALIVQGRAFEALERLEQIYKRRFRIKLTSSCSLMEPGVFGIFRPVLFIPAGMSERLSDSELEAILAHELTHVRRRDNLVAAIHMFVQALFWFHPLVWWLGAKLVQEREWACDEEVLRLGKDPQDYAEGILKICEFYLESPLACVSGVTGADMKKRIHAIMTHRIGSRLGFAKKLLLAIAGIAALVMPFLIGLLNVSSSRAQPQDSPKPSFDVASVKPSNMHTGMQAMQGDGRLSLDGVTAKYLISNAYGLQDFQLSGGPAWIAKDIFSIDAKAADPATPGSQINLMLQSLLEERFKLKFHREQREMPTYSLVIARDGHKLKAAALESGSVSMGSTIDGNNRKIIRIEANGKTITKAPSYMHNITGYNSMQGLAKILARIVSRPVTDKTGLAGRYEVFLEWGLEAGQEGALAASASGDPAGESAGLSIFTAIQEQLGLKLEPDKGLVEFFIIESIEKPSEN